MLLAYLGYWRHWPPTRLALPRVRSVVWCLVTSVITSAVSACWVISLLLMGGSSVLVGLLPSYHQIGVAAPTLLVLLRLARLGRFALVFRL